LAGLANISSGTSPSAKIVIDLALGTTADKAVKAILPFFKELSNDERWIGLLSAWIKFEDGGPPKSVSFFYIDFYLVYFSTYIFSDCQLTIVLVKLLYG
jgi:hypothetical protein